MDQFLEVFKIAVTGMIGIFTAILLIYLMILLLTYAFPSKKRVKRVISRKTGEVLEETPLKDQ